MKSAETFVFSGGGTGGHLFPGIAVAEELRARNSSCRILFVGSERELEQRTLASYAFEHRSLPVESLAAVRRRPLSFAQRNWRSYRIAQEWIEAERPVAVIGLGGFASAPVVMAAAKTKVPVVLLEQNVIPGRTTRWLSRWADRVCATYPETVGLLSKGARANVTGNPVRREIAALHAARFPKDRESRGTLLVLGGSQGASALNRALPHCVEQLGRLARSWRIIHQTGTVQADSVREQYDRLGVEATVAAFLPDIQDVYAQATVVVSRAGATTLAELACAGLPAVLVPYPHAALDHQAANARWWERRGAAFVAPQDAEPSVTAERIADHLQRLLADSARLPFMQAAIRQAARPDAARAVVDCLLELVGRRGLQRSSAYAQ